MTNQMEWIEQTINNPVYTEVQADDRITEFQDQAEFQDQVEFQSKDASYDYGENQKMNNPLYDYTCD